MSSSLSFKIARPPSAGSASTSASTSRVGSPLARPPATSRPSSSSATNNRNRAWQNDDSDSDDDGDNSNKRKDELVTGFDSENGLTKKHTQPKAAPLSIPSLPNRNWREEATRNNAAKQNGGGRSRKGAREMYIPGASGTMRMGGGTPGAAGVEASEGGMGTTDKINDSVVVGGLELGANRGTDENAMDLDTPDGEASSAAVAGTALAPPAVEEAALPARPLETDDQRALRELMAGEVTAEEFELDMILPAAPDNRQAPADETDAFRRDLLSRPDEPTLDDYARVPTSQFGAALLRGMGWKEGTPATRSNRKGLSEAYVPTSRPALLGIGAKPMKEVLGEEKGKNGKPIRKDRREEMKYVPLVRRDTGGGESGASGRSEGFEPRFGLET